MSNETNKSTTTDESSPVQVRIPRDLKRAAKSALADMDVSLQDWLQETVEARLRELPLPAVSRGKGRASSSRQSTEAPHGA
jgi:hypothetical protein